jgi:hypothetical protein
MVLIPAHEATTTRDCRTPGCLGEADSSGLCRSCQQPAANGKAKVRFEKTGLVVDGELDDDELRALLQRLGRMESAIAWWVGDALVLAEKHWRTTWAGVLEELGLSAWTASAYRWIAGAVPIERRREGLGISHYRLIAARPPAEQEAWLDRVEKERMTVRALETALKSEKAQLGRVRPSKVKEAAPVATVVDITTERQAREPKRPELEQVDLRVTAEAESIARWKAAASKRGVSLAALAVEALELLTAPP